MIFGAVFHTSTEYKPIPLPHLVARRDDSRQTQEARAELIPEVDVDDLPNAVHPKQQKQDMVKES